MSRFRVPYLVPPGRVWFYLLPDKTLLETRAGMDDLVRKIRDWYGEHDPEHLPSEADAEVWVQEYMCGFLPEGFCDAPPAHPMPDYFTVAESTRRIAEYAERTNKYGHVLEPELDRRASACMHCPRHVLHFCLSCRGILSMFERQLAGQISRYNRILRVCGVHVAAIPVMLHADPDAIRDCHPSLLKYGEYPEGCWLKDTKESKDEHA